MSTKSNSKKTIQPSKNEPLDTSKLEAFREVVKSRRASLSSSSRQSCARKPIRSV